jgi:hypothetical protein
MTLGRAVKAVFCSRQMVGKHLNRKLDIRSITINQPFKAVTVGADPSFTPHPLLLLRMCVGVQN